jgi:very-short-patch-repair endonuclease/ribosomal protein L37AE/L43A
MAKPSATDDEKQEIIRRYTEGADISTLIGEFHRSRETLKRILVDGGVTLRTPSAATLNWLAKVQASGTVNTPIERRMQDALMAAGIGFRTQRLLLDHYLVDILINQAPIVIEADGMIHTHPLNAAKDVRRDAALTEAGYRVFRFTGSEINTDATACVQRLIDACGLTPDEEPVYDIRTSFTGEDHPNWNGGKQEYTCEQCGRKFLAQPKHRTGNGVYCSRKCANAAKRGKTHTAETRAKVSEALTRRKGEKRKPLTDEHRNKVRVALTGKKKSPEHVAKVAAANKGRPVPMERRARISATLKARNSQIKIESGLRGDAQRSAETTGPLTLW